MGLVFIFFSRFSRRICRGTSFRSGLLEVLLQRGLEGAYVDEVHLASASAAGT